MIYTHDIAAAGASRVSVTPADVHTTLSRYMLADGFEIVLDLDRSKGSYIVDAVTGKRYLDFFTFFGSNPVGMNHPAIANDEFLRKIGRIALHKPSSSDLYTVEMAEFVETFFRVAVPSHFKYCFFIEGGAMAVENALKVAFDWKVKKNFKKGITREVGHRVIHFRRAFHGRSGYTMSLTNTEPTKTALFPKFEGWPRINNPSAHFPLQGENLRRTMESESIALEEIRRAIAEYGDDIAAIIVEPIQAEGGDNHFRKEFHEQLRMIADLHDVMLIHDEVQTGIGMTGRMWAHEAIGVTPDLIAFGKKTQVCGVLAGPRVDEVEDNVFHASSRINSTWGGNLVDMVRFTRFLEIIQEERLVDNAREVGEHLKTRLQELQEEFPEMINNARGLGLLCAFDLTTHELRDLLRKEAFERGVIILPAGERSIRFRPPLNISVAEVDEGIAVLRASLVELRSGVIPDAVEEVALPPAE